MTDIPSISRALCARTPRLLPPSSRTHAAVALIVRHTVGDAEVLFIERAAHEDDPWSGDLGFPGGKIEATDGTPRAGAERETLEEIGLDLKNALFLGRLDDITGAYLPVLVSCFVYALPSPAPLSLSHEVTDAFWFPLEQLKDPGRHLETTVRFGGKKLTRPAIRLPGYDRRVLWGITYRLLIQFLQILKAGS